MNLKEKLTEALIATGAIQTDDWYVSLNKQDIETLLNAIQDKWIPVDVHNLPKGDVLAYSYQGEMLFGHMSYELDGVFCETDCEILTDVTHYQIPTPPKG